VITCYDLLRRLAGLSQAEAAALHGVRLDTMKSWCGGRREAPPGVLDEIRTLIARQAAAAEQALALFGGAPAAAAIELSLAVDDADARAAPLGWPCRSAQATVLARVIAGLPAGVEARIVDRDSTPAKPSNHPALPLHVSGARMPHRGEDRQRNKAGLARN
jgi:hypothetical protein